MIMGEEMKGQVSAEMLILLAVVIAIVAIAASYLISVSKSAGESVQNQTSSILSETKDITAKGNPGDPCVDKEDCKSNVCGSDNRCG
jgi:uncharacterized protein (UPF0333 family)